MATRAQREVDKILTSFKRKYKRLADVVLLSITNYMEIGLTPDNAVARAFKDNQVEKWMLTTSLESIVTAAALGIGSKESPAVLMGKRGLIGKIMAQSYDESRSDFSARIHGTTTKMRKTITATIKAGLRDQKTIATLSTELYDGFGYGAKINHGEVRSKLEQIAQLRINGEPLSDGLKLRLKQISKQIDKLQTVNLRIAYGDVIKSIESESKKAIEKSLYVAVQEKSRYQASRIARTETSRAYYNATLSKYVNDPDVSAVKVTLSTGHKIYDICDVYANADMGYGKGVYPLNSLPEYPLHPNCFCRLSPVFIDEVPEKEKFTKETQTKGVTEFLESQSPEQLVQLMGVDGYNAFVEKGSVAGLKNASKFIKAKKMFSVNDFTT